MMLSLSAIFLELVTVLAFTLCQPTRKDGYKPTVPVYHPTLAPLLPPQQTPLPSLPFRGQEPYLVEPLQNIVSFEGGNTEFTCKVGGTRSQYSISWFVKNTKSDQFMDIPASLNGPVTPDDIRIIESSGQELPSLNNLGSLYVTSKFSLDDVDVYKLHIINVTLNDEFLFNCAYRFLNETTYNRATIGNWVKVKVHALPKPQCLYEPTNITVVPKAGVHLNLTCFVQNSDLPSVHVLWLVGEEQISDPASSPNTISQILYSSDVRKKYRCMLKIDTDVLERPSCSIIPLDIGAQVSPKALEINASSSVVNATFECTNTGIATAETYFRWSILPAPLKEVESESGFEITIYPDNSGSRIVLPGEFIDNTVVTCQVIIPPAIAMDNATIVVMANESAQSGLFNIEVIKLSGLMISLLFNVVFSIGKVIYILCKRNQRSTKFRSKSVGITGYTSIGGSGSTSSPAGQTEMEELHSKQTLPGNSSRNGQSYQALKKDQKVKSTYDTLKYKPGICAKISVESPEETQGLLQECTDLHQNSLNLHEASPQELCQQLEGLQQSKEDLCQESLEKVCKQFPLHIQQESSAADLYQQSPDDLCEHSPNDLLKKLSSYHD